MKKLLLLRPLQVITYIREAARLHTVNNPSSNLATISSVPSTTCGATTTTGLTQLVRKYEGDVSVAITLPFAFTYLG